MSSSRHNYLEEARPPEDPVKRKYYEKVRGNYRYYYKRPSVSLGAVSLASGVLLIPEPDIRDSNAGAVGTVAVADGTRASRLNNNCVRHAQLDPSVDEPNSNLHESENFNRTNQSNGNDVDSTIDSNYNNTECNNRTARATVKSISMTTPPPQNCTMRSENNQGTRSTGSRRPASLPSTEQNATGTNRKRCSYHQDVEEALSSLLWQPYEYRTQSDSSDTLSSLSTTGSSSSSTSLSLDLAANKNKGAGAAGLLQSSFTDEFLNVTTPTATLPVGGDAAWTHNGNTADPNLTTTQMVSNLMVLDAASVGPALAQYAWTTQSRGYDGGLAFSQVDLERSRVRELVSRCSRLSSNAVTTAGTAVVSTTTAAAHQQQQQYYPSRCSNHNNNNNNIGNASGSSVRVYRSAVCDDIQPVSGGDMRVEIPGSGPPPERQATISVPDVTYTPPKQTVAISTSSASTSGHRQQNVLFQCNSVSVGTGAPPATTECVSIQTVASPSSTVRMTAGDGGGNRSSIHQVQPALSVNTRCTTGGAGVCTISSDMIPSNITSVVSANVVGLPVHSRSSSNLSAASRADIVPPNHPRSMSETANVFIQAGQQHNVGNHLRSSSNSHAVVGGLVPNHPRNHSLTGVVQTRGTSEPVSVTANSSMTASVFASNSQRASSVPHQSVAASVTANATTSVLHNHVRASSEHAPRNSNFEATPKQTDVTTNVYHGRSTTAQDAPPPQSRVPPLPNVSNVNVNFYRAVPVNVVSSVPTIQCLNSVEDSGNNVSNVHIVQAMPATVPCIAVTTQQVLVQQHQPPPTPVQPHQQQYNVPEVRTRTFTSTEAQTDDTAVGQIVAPTVLPPTREQRRRDRRDRRHQRRLNSSNHQHQLQMQQQLATGQMQQHWPAGNAQQQQQQQQQQNERLPDLLNSHLPPPYSTLPSSMQPAPMVPAPIVTSAIMAPNTMVASPIVPNTLVSFHPAVVPGQVPLVQGAPPVPVPAPPTGFRFPFPTAAGFRRCRSRLGPRYSTEEHQPKSCCGFLVNRPGSLRWFIALIALVAVCCVLVGTVLGAMRPAGRDHLTVSLLMIGVGIVLVTVSGVAWRLTSHDAPSCRAMLGLESSDSAEICTRRFVPRLPPSYGRPHHPYAAMIYPEFQYRPPPPSYQASMQEYRLRLLLLDRGASPQITNAQHAVSPPPTYRSHAGSLLRAPLSNRRDATQSEYSCPPSYRSRTSTNRQASMDNTVHSREQSLSLSESNHDGSVVNVVNILANQEEEIALENMTLDSLKVAPENEIPPLRMLLKSSSGSDLETSKDGNLVTIVQKADQNPVIVTVSGSQMSTTNPEVGSSNQSTEMEILAHL